MNEIELNKLNDLALQALSIQLLAPSWLYSLFYWVYKFSRALMCP